jgi:hypothetical protein
MLSTNMQYKTKQDAFVKQIIKYYIYINLAPMLNKYDQTGLF